MSAMEQVLLKDLSNLQNYSETKVTRMAVETLIKIYRNIKQNDGDPKYTRIKINNPAFFEKIWRHRHAVHFMFHSGWSFESKDAKEICFDDNPDSVDLTLKILLENRDVVPCENEWDESTKLEGKSPEQLREEELKRKAMEERDKELAAFLKEKKEREVIAKLVKAEHKADRVRVKSLKSQPSSDDLNEATKMHSVPPFNEKT